MKKSLLVRFKINLLKGLPQIPVRYAHSAGINLDDDGLEIFTNETADQKLNLNEKYIGLCPGAKHFTKRWPKEYFIKLGKKLEQAEYKIILFGGPEEIELCENIANELPDSLNLCDESILKCSVRND